MGDNITYEAVRDVAVENGQTVDEALRIMNATVAEDRAQHPEEYERAWDAGQG